MKKILLTTAAAVAVVATASIALADSPTFHPIADADFLGGFHGTVTAQETDQLRLNPIADADLLAGADEQAFDSKRVEDKVWCNSLADADMLGMRECPVLAAARAEESDGR